MDDVEGELRRTIIEIQDFLAPLLDSYEQMIYHYLFRHSRLLGMREIVVGTRAIQGQVGHGMGNTGRPPSQRIVSDKIRSLERKSCVRVLERSVRGTRLEVLLPSEIPGVVKPRQEEALVNVEDLDFFNTPSLRVAMLRREQHRCFYCRRSLSEENFSLDHVKPRSGATEDNSYKNLAACCWECNSRKQSTDVHIFLRRLYREDLLSAEEHQDRVKNLEDLSSGRLVPDIAEPKRKPGGDSH